MPFGLDHDPAHLGGGACARLAAAAGAESAFAGPRPAGRTATACSSRERAGRGSSGRRRNSRSPSGPAAGAGTQRVSECSLAGTVATCEIAPSFTPTSTRVDSASSGPRGMTSRQSTATRSESPSCTMLERTSVTRTARGAIGRFRGRSRKYHAASRRGDRGRAAARPAGGIRRAVRPARCPRPWPGAVTTGRAPSTSHALLEDDVHRDALARRAGRGRAWSPAGIVARSAMKRFTPS